MTDKHDTTRTDYPVCQKVSFLHDEYEALATLAANSGYSGTELLILLDGLNSKFGMLCDEMDKEGLLS